MKDSRDNIPHLLSYALIFVLEHHLFLEAHSFPRVSHSRNCLRLETDHVCGQISEHIFPPNGGYCIQSRPMGQLFIMYLTEYHYSYPLKMKMAFSITVIFLVLLLR